MNFVWNMTEENWKNLYNDHKSRDCDSLSSDFDFYGNCYIGHLCADIQHTGDDSDDTSWYAFVNVFGLGIDDGYGETESGIPYSLVHCDFSVPMDCDTFESFKEAFEKNFTEAINYRSSCKELANRPLGNWN